MRNLLRSTVVVLALLLAGCSAGGGEDSAGPGAVDRSSAADGAVEMDDSGGFEESAADGETAGDAGGVNAEQENRQFVVEGSVSLTVDSPRRAAQEVALLVEHLGGHVQERVEQGTEDDEDANAHLVVRIPSGEVTGALEQLEELGTIEDTSITSTEVTAQARDLDARIRALEISVTRLEDLLSRADSTADVVAAEQALTERQSELESLQSQRNRLADRVELSTIRVNLWTPDTVPPEAPDGFWGGLVTGWNSLVATVSGILMALGVLLPWAIAIGLVTLAVLAGLRWSKRRQAATALPAAPAPGAPGGGSPAGPGAGPTTSLPPTAPAPPPARAAAPPPAAPSATTGPSAPAATDPATPEPTTGAPAPASDLPTEAAPGDAPDEAPPKKKSAPRKRAPRKPTGPEKPTDS